jgi:hypothetical protein
MIRLLSTFQIEFDEEFIFLVGFIWLLSVLYYLKPNILDTFDLLIHETSSIFLNSLILCYIIVQTLVQTIFILIHVSDLLAYPKLEIMIFKSA